MPSRQHDFQRERAGKSPEHEQAEEERRLSQGGESGFARTAHSLEGGAGIECGSDGEETAEGEQVGKEDRVALEGQGRVSGDRQQHAREQRGREADHGPRFEDPRGRGTEHRTLPPQLDEVVVELEVGWSHAPGEGSFGLVDHSEQERRREQEDRHVHRVEEERVQVHFHTRRRMSVRRM